MWLQTCVGTWCRLSGSLKAEQRPADRVKALAASAGGRAFRSSRMTRLLCSCSAFRCVGQFCSRPTGIGKLLFVGTIVLRVFISASSTALGGPPESVPLIASELEASATAGSEFSYRIVATNAPTRFEATALPPGLTLDQSTGVIRGAPRYPLEYFIPVFATNGDGTGSAIVRLHVQSPSRGPFIVAPERDTAVAGMPYGYAVACVNDPTSVEANGLPDGLVLMQGVIRGIPKFAGTFPIELRASNAHGTTTSILTLSVGDVETASTRLVSVVHVIPPRAGNYCSGIAWYLEVWFNGPVAVTGLPRIPITIGTSTRYAVWEGPPLDNLPAGYRALRFGLVLDPADFDDDGINVASSIDLNGGSIRDANGNNVGLAFAPPDTRGVRVGQWPPSSPRIISVASDGSGGSSRLPREQRLVIRGISGGQTVDVYRADGTYVGAAAGNEVGEWSLNVTSNVVAPGLPTFFAMNRSSSAEMWSPPSNRVSVASTATR
jgi:hypothetical protein